MLSAITLGLALQTSITPVPRMELAWWKERHDQKVELTKQGGHELIFIGDSITHRWERDGLATWNKFYAHRKAANFGYGGDRTEHVLWRFENGEMKGLKPKVAVMMIGTNNLGTNTSTVDETALGVRTIVAKLRENMPETKILVLGIFPRGAESTDKLRIAVAEVSRQISALEDRKRVFYLDLSKPFIARDGSLWRGLMPDLLHPNAEGYEIWAKAMEPTLKQLLGE